MKPTARGGVRARVAPMVGAKGRARVASARRCVARTLNDRGRDEMMTSNKCGVGCKALVGAIAMAVPSVALAEPPPRITAAAEVLMVPTGTIEFSSPSDADSAALQPSLGVGVQVEYWITDGMAVAFAPRVIDVRPDSDEDSATQFDLVGRLQGRQQVTSETQGIGYFGLGYSTLVLPEGNETPSGLLIDLGLGLRRTLGGAVFLQGHIGYAFGFQGGTLNGISYSLSTSGLHFGVGVGTAL